MCHVVGKYGALSGSKLNVQTLSSLNFETSLFAYNYRIYPRIGRTFFKEKTFKIWGVAYTQGTRVLSSLIRKISRQTQSQQSYSMLDSLIECIVWGQINPRLRRIFLLSAAMSVSSFRICLSLDEVEVCMSSRETLSIPFKWNRVCLFSKLREKYTEPVIKRKIHKWNWYKI